MTNKEIIEIELQTLETCVRMIRNTLKKARTTPQTLKEVEKSWSDVLDLLHPHQRDDESIYQTAKRVIPSS